MVFSKRIAATSIAGLSYDSESLPLLPEELISEIYTPKASCENLAEDAKSWLSLISTNNQEYTHHSLLFIKNWTTFHTCSLKAVMHEKSPFIPIERACRYKKYFIWNPSTREFKELPLSQRDITGSYRETYGFGYNECQKDYKIVVIKRKKDTEYGLSFIVVWEVICVFYVDDHRMDVWVMKEHGLGESWNLVISVPLCNFGRPWPIFIFQNDEVLLKDGSRRELYMYVESLISPNSLVEFKELRINE
ncbi:uncharacterized protein [Nicotiana sylvestris]|uniref:uncharacterized protein n=1 Tax=Nicotiana sylvestris TaxID=4096 RepID=UPI00388C45E2